MPNLASRITPDHESVMRSANQVPVSGMACSAQIRSCAYMAMRIGMPADAFASLVCYSGDAMTILVITVDCLSYCHCHIMINRQGRRQCASVAEARC